MGEVASVCAMKSYEGKESEDVRLDGGGCTTGSISITTLRSDAAHGGARASALAALVWRAEDEGHTTSSLTPTSLFAGT